VLATVNPMPMPDQPFPVLSGDGEAMGRGIVSMA
jgi:hypothetical protein